MSKFFDGPPTALAKYIQKCVMAKLSKDETQAAIHKFQKRRADGVDTFWIGSKMVTLVNNPTKGTENRQVTYIDKLINIPYEENSDEMDLRIVNAVLSRGTDTRAIRNDVAFLGVECEDIFGKIDEIATDPTQLPASRSFWSRDIEGLQHTKDGIVKKRRN